MRSAGRAQQSSPSRYHELGSAPCILCLLNSDGASPPASSPPVSAVEDAAVILCRHEEKEAVVTIHERSMAHCDVLRACLLLLVTVFFLVAGTAILGCSQTDDSGTYKAVVVLRELCDKRRQVNLTALRLLVADYNHTELDFLDESDVCEPMSGGLAALLDIMADSDTDALIGSIDPSLCDLAIKLATLRGKSFVTWSCPQLQPTDNGSIFTSLVPPLSATAEALLRIVKHFRWKYAAILASDSGWWPQLAHTLDLSLRAEGLVVRHHLVLHHSSSVEQLSSRLQPLQTAPCRVLILCLPVRSSFAETVLKVVQELRLAHLPATTLLAVHLSSASAFLPVPEYLPPAVLGVAARQALLVLVSSRGELGQLWDESPEQSGGELGELLREALSALCGAGQTSYSYVLVDWLENNASFWRPLLQLHLDNSSHAVLDTAYPLLEDWTRMKQKHDDPEVTCEETEDGRCVLLSTAGSSELLLRGAHIAAIVISSALFATAVIVVGALARKQLLKKRMSKGPYKILLTPSDFVFPHVQDSLRVDEGIETMLCCWLQQLQEFGGPEVDKPDLLKGSVGSLRSHQLVKSAGSTSSLARNILVDHKARYNGDLVQLKELPGQGTFELKSKAMDVLVTLHGLRHENMNPLIGCLTDPARPALVFEWCSRGSLEDVLVQDEIKLDWSFRLSLLTDLVRGMRYLHSSPIRVHGYLTSRNCVIDARWVLKVTDYGLPAFYDAQNLSPPSRSARELLWTAPELLRNSSLRKQGTQPGDVYSFSIIMQEVVVRGEPFCMLALTPEEIMEKVKRPPPLIRPSVSKGAAPPEAINIMRQCWAEQADMRPDFNAVHDLFKKLNHGRKVNFVDTMFQMLEKYSNNLEELIRERTEQLDMEKKKTEQLLNRMLPSSVADKLKLGMPVDPEDFREVTIYFSDIVGFTTISAYSTPFEVVDLLNDLYTCFDATINAYNVYKVETIGDAYMVVGGLPVRIPDHADQIATMALDLLHQSGRFKIRHLPCTPLRLRIGLHTGPCCAGVVGLTMPRYCLFGDTVNTASRMESTGSAWRIHLSQATKDQLDAVGGYHLEFRGETDVKGKGKMPTFWLLGKAGFNKELPQPPPLDLDERLILCSRSGVSQTVEALEMPRTRSEDNSSGDVSFAMSTTSGGLTPPNFSSTVSCKGSVSNTNLNAGNHHGTLLQHSAPASVKSMSVSHLPFDIKSMKVRAAVHAEKQETCSNEDSKVSAADHQSSVVKSMSTDHQMAAALGTPVSATEVAAALLGVSSTTSLNNFRSSNFGNRESKHRRPVGHIDEDDLSTPYNHYRCLSPSEQHLNHLHVKSHHTATAATPNRFLKRQFSLDRGDDSVHMTSLSTMTLDTASSTSRTSSTSRLNKQNSAGAAHDLERIEEIPLANSGSPGHHSKNNSYFRQRCELPPFSASSMSVSVESLN